MTQPAASPSSLTLSRDLQTIATSLWMLRTEILLATPLILLALWMHAQHGPTTATIAAGLLAAPLLAWPPSRAQLTRTLHNAKVRRAWRRALHSLNHPELYGPTRAQPSRLGTQLKVRIPRGQDVTELQKLTDQLRDQLAAREIRIHPHETGGRAHITIITRDPLATETGPPPWTDEHHTSLWDPFPIGISEHGRPTILRLPYKTLLTGGTPGSGKTTLLHQLIARAALDPAVTLLIADGKELDFGPWRPVCAAYAESDPKDLDQVLNTARDWMRRSKERLAAQSKAKVEPGDPLCLLILDELTAWPQATDPKSPTYQLLMHAVSRGRALGLITIISTQRPDVQAIPGGIRDNVDLRCAFRTKTRQASDTILGQAPRDQDASTLPDRPGLMLLDTGSGPRLARGHYLNPATVTRIAEHAVLLRGGPTATASKPADAARTAQPTILPSEPGQRTGESRTANAGPGGQDIPPAASRLAEAILTILPTTPPGYRREEVERALAAHTGTPHPPRDWWQHHRQLVTDGRIVRTGTGRKGSPYRYRRAPAADS